jgi:hypothetical protein
VTTPDGAATLAGLPLAEKASLTGGVNFWYTKAIDRHGGMDVDPAMIDALLAAANGAGSNG